MTTTVPITDHHQASRAKADDDVHPLRRLDTRRKLQAKWRNNARAYQNNACNDGALARYDEATRYVDKLEYTVSDMTEPEATENDGDDILTATRWSTWRLAKALLHERRQAATVRIDRMLTTVVEYLVDVALLTEYDVDKQNGRLVKRCKGDIEHTWDPSSHIDYTSTYKPSYDVLRSVDVIASVLCGRKHSPCATLIHERIPCVMTRFVEQATPTAGDVSYAETRRKAIKSWEWSVKDCEMCIKFADSVEFDGVSV